MWSEEFYDKVIIHTYTLRYGKIEVVVDKETDDVEVVAEIHSPEFNLELYDYYPKARQRDKIVEEVIGLLHDISTE